LWAARTVSQWGDIAQFTTLALLVFHLTGPGLGVSGVVVAEIVPVLLLLAPLAGPLVAASLGYKTDVPCLSDGWRWSAVRVLSGRCETPVVGPGGSAISRNRPRWHRVGLKPGIGSWPLWRRGDVGYVEQAVDRASSRVLAGAGVRLVPEGGGASVFSLRHPFRG
jgi:hypothetical protein